MSTLLASLPALLLVLAAKGPDPADVKPGWLGFGMFLLLALATVLLWLSFRKQLKKIHFPEDDSPAGESGDSSGTTPS